MSAQPSLPKKIAAWRSQVWRGRLYQLVVLAALLGLLFFLAHNTRVNMDARGIHSGWDFLQDGAGFDIGESLFAFDSSEPYWKAFLIGFSNTLRVSLLGIVLSTLLGTLLGVGRLSSNILVRGLCGGYVELVRNIPLLLQLLMWYLLCTELLPAASEPLALGPLYLSKGGLNFPIPLWSNAALAIDHPHPGPFAVEGGGALSPEFLSLLLGLSLYSAAFIAELVRSGIQSVPRGQTEAAAALGLSRSQTLRRVTLPQALRVIIPPATNQFLNLTKNSSLAVVIGYPDVVSIANTALNQTGRAVECIALLMLVYLCTSLLTALGMHWLNQRAAIRER